MPAAKGDDRRVPVLLPYPFPGPFDYRVPTNLDLKPGDVVLVPLNRREEVGVVWDAPAGDLVPADRLKSVVGLIDTPPMGHSLRRFIDWIAAYTLTAPGDVLAMALRVVSSVDRPVIAYRRADPLPATRLTPPRQRVLDVLAAEEPLPAADLMRQSEVSAAVLRAMAAAGLLVTEAAARRSPFLPPDPDYPGRSCHPSKPGLPACCGRLSRAAGFPSPCWTASPARARPRSIWRPSPHV